MKRAGVAVTQTLFNVAGIAAKALGIQPLIKYGIGVQLEFTQPDVWYEEQVENKTTAASVMVGVIAVFFILVMTSSAFDQFYGNKSVD